MFSLCVVLVIILIKVPNSVSLSIDEVDCGVDHSLDVKIGEVDVEAYPWLGVVFYSYEDYSGHSRAITTVVLVQEEILIGPAADIGAMPKVDFVAKAKVVLGEDWNGVERRIRTLVLHPEYGATYNTLALIQLRDKLPYTQAIIKPICPPPEMLRNPEFYVIRYNSDYNYLKKEVIPMVHVPGKMCKDFYVAANLYAEKMRPPHVVCAVSLETEDVCVWEAGGVLVTRDVWGRWQFLGLGVRGPGCGAPSRYLDMLSYYPWIRESLSQFKQLDITQLSKQKYVIRSTPGQVSYKYHGACLAEEKVNLIYREGIVLRTDNTQFQFAEYNMTIFESIDLSCFSLELVNASGGAEMKVRHFLTREPYGAPCYTHRISRVDINIHIMFSDKCLLEMYIWGWKRNMTLIDIMDWKWEEGTYYNDFWLERDEYRGQTFMTGYGYEPVDQKQWVPEYDYWTTTEAGYGGTSSTTGIPDRMTELNESYFQEPVPPTFTPRTTTTTTTTPTTTKRKFKTRTTTKLTTTRRP